MHFNRCVDDVLVHKTQWQRSQRSEGSLWWTMETLLDFIVDFTDLNFLNMNILKSTIVGWSLGEPWTAYKGEAGNTSTQIVTSVWPPQQYPRVLLWNLSTSQQSSDFFVKFKFFCSTIENITSLPSYPSISNLIPFVAANDHLNFKVSFG